MNKYKRDKILLVIFILGIFVLGLVEANYSQAKQTRNLKDYKEGPTLEDWDSRWGDAEVSGAMNHINNYVWELWNKKELAFFRMNSYNKHGGKLTAIYYVEKGKNDNWQLTVELDLIDICPYKSKQKCEETRYKTFIYNKIEKTINQHGVTILKLENVSEN
jgi:hypothetical protein